MNQWLQFCGGLGIFLLGVTVMTDGLRGLARDALRTMLTRFTHSAYSGALTGAISTAVLQSSSATTVAAVGFVSAGLLSFTQALGIIFGANLGTTITGWLVALLGFKLDLESLLLPAVLVGVLVQLFGRGRIKSAGMALAGFGLLFVGIATMQAGMAGMGAQLTPDSFPPDTWLGRLQLLLLGILITLLTQSSSAGVAAALTAVHAGSISFEQAAAMVIGMDVGTTVTALFATIAGSQETRRTGYSHVVYNLFTGIGAYLLLTPYVMLWQWISPSAIYGQPEIALVAFHSSFNLLGVIAVVPVSDRFARLMFRLVPEHPNDLVRRLDDRMLADPAVALEAVRATVKDIAIAQIQYTLDLIQGRVGEADERLKYLDSATIACQKYLDAIHSTPERDREWPLLMACIHALDHMGRLCDRLAYPQRAQLWRENDRLATLAKDLIKGFQDLLDLDRTGKGWVAVAERASVVARYCREDAQLTRECLMADVAQGREELDRGDLLIEASRWQYRVADHIWRISHYVAEAEQKSYLAVTAAAAQPANRHNSKSA